MINAPVSITPMFNTRHKTIPPSYFASLCSDSLCYLYIKNRQECSLVPQLKRPLKSRGECKILVLTNKYINGQASYLKELIVSSYHLIRTLRSQDAGLLVIPRNSQKQNPRQRPQLSSSCPVGPSHRLGEGDRHSLLSGVGLKLSYLIKLMVRADLSSSQLCCYRLMLPGGHSMIR